MVDFNNISPNLKGRIEKIMSGEGKDEKKIDSYNEYSQLTSLLSGSGKVSGKEKEFVEGMIADYQEEFMVSQNVKERVLEIIKFGETNKADDNEEIKSLKNYKKTKGLTKEEKNWIQKIIDGRTFELKQTVANVNHEPTVSHFEQPESIKTESTKKPEGYGKEPTHEPPSNTNPDFKKPELDTPVPKSKKPELKMPEENKTVPKTEEPDYGNEIPKDEPAFTEENPKTEEASPKNNIKKMTPKEIKIARDTGALVADRLLGFTSNVDQRNVQDIIENINSDNVMEFFRGYEEKVADETSWGVDDSISLVFPTYSVVKHNKDSFFEQMQSEFDFPEKQELMHKVAKDLEEYFTKKYGADSKAAQEVAIIRLERDFNEKQAVKLDNIVKDELAKN